MKTKVVTKNETFKKFKKQYTMHIFVWLGLLFLLIFSVVPMLGIVVAFKEYDIRSGFLGMFTGEFAGFKYFIQFFTDRKFETLLRNTLMISVLKLIFSFPLPIMFAIMLSEMKGNGFKRIVQTVSYLPHFISWVIVTGILFSFFSTTRGVFNEILVNWGIVDEPIPILMEAEYYYGLAVSSEVWKEMGWNAIIYLAAIAGIDPTLYESAHIDGAGRLQRIWYITLPSIKGAISILLILAIGGLLSSANFEQALLLGNSMNISRSEIIEVYVYKKGLGLGRYSFAAAAGLIQSIISFILVLSANTISKKLSNTSLF
ncbi:ABC transporter permease [Vallitalea okinawensis]|uniref:ABC transporter permease n=1 Tax=Vallitalea okinawensis TaxID=2078660 RepID=UPI000CFC6FA1|nr:ABC transporter permease subunit [Vallitalea okinawensis]